MNTNFSVKLRSHQACGRGQERAERGFFHRGLPLHVLTVESGLVWNVNMVQISWILLQTFSSSALFRCMTDFVSNNPSRNYSFLLHDWFLKGWHFHGLKRMLPKRHKQSGAPDWSKFIWLTFVCSLVVHFVSRLKHLWKFWTWKPKMYMCICLHNLFTGGGHLNVRFQARCECSFSPKTLQSSRTCDWTQTAEWCSFSPQNMSGSCHFLLT